MLDHLNLEPEYRTTDCDIVESFYRPCLKHSTHYDRAVGYFRSSVVVVYGEPIVDFAERGGKIRIVCSPDMTPEDIEAIEKGHLELEDKISTLLIEDLKELVSTQDLKKRIEVLATLVALGTLEIKVAFVCQGSGIYHEKLGIFHDAESQNVSFIGSSNETWSGWSPKGNYERNEVFCSWKGADEYRRVKRHMSHFEKLWNNHISSIKVMGFPKAAKNLLIQYRQKSIDDLRPKNKIKKPVEITPRDHQAQALIDWNSARQRGILEHATGSGKTITALLASRDHLKSGNPVLILVPSRLLLKQWSEEIAKVIPQVVVLKVGGGNNDWKTRNRLQHFTKSSSSSHQRLVLATIQTARGDEFLSGIAGGEHLLIIADEVHQVGARENSKALGIDSGPRLGLSATPKRFGDPEGTQKLFDYFGAIIQPPFTLRDAVSSGALCEYEYYPHVIHLTEEESDQWARLTSQIGFEISRSSKDGDGSLSDKAKRLLIRRARISKKAHAKINLATKVIAEHFKSGQRWLVYCDDVDQLETITEELKQITREVSVYHSKMEGDREAALEWFGHSSGILVSIACLDEGVDIPAASHALILASSQNPRQFIQRRGRVLRKSKLKKIAVIHDAIVAPVDVTLQPQQTSLLEAELARSIQFAEDALNASSIHEVRTIAINAGLDPSSLSEVGIEEDEE